MKKYVPIFFDWTEQTTDLTQEQKGNLIDAVVDYFANGEQYVIDQDSPKQMKEIFLKTTDKAYRFLNGEKKGEFHWNWQGGKTPENQRERSSKAYTEWRIAVFARDNFTCQVCGQVGGTLNAHHIKRWSTNVNERYRVDNGVTLCKRCHRMIHKKDGE